MPKEARWSVLKEKAALPAGTVLWKNGKGEDVKLRSVSWLIDNALDEIEKVNIKLKGILNRISQYQLDNEKLIGLINSFSDTSFSNPELDGEKINLHSFKKLTEETSAVNVSVSITQRASFRSKYGWGFFYALTIII